MKKSKDIKLKLNYTESSYDKIKKTYYGKVDEPKYTDELRFHIDDEFVFDFERDDFVKNGMYSLEISGTNRALMEFGKFLINVSLYETVDPDYHEHCDEICDNTGKPSVNITIRKH